MGSHGDDVSHSREFLEGLLQAVPAFVLRVSPERIITFVNRAKDSYDVDQIIGRPVAAIVPDTAGAVTAAFDEAERTRRPVEYEGSGDPGAKDETHRYHVTVVPIVEDDDRVAFVLHAVDVTEQRRLEAERRQMGDWLRLAVDATGIGLWRQDLRSGEVSWNEQMHAITGCAQPVPLEQYAEHVVPDDRTLLMGNVDALVREGAVRAAPHRFVRPDGSVRWVTAHGDFLRDDHGTPVQVVGGSLDVTDLQQLEQQLKQAQKLEAVGQLTAGIAHNFNNLLTAIIPTLELVKDAVPADLRPLVDDADHSAQRAAELIRQLMTFAGKGQGDSPQLRSLQEILAPPLRLCERVFPASVQIVRKIPARPIPLLGSPALLEQAILNVLVNSRDALAAREGGTVTVAVDDTEPSWVELVIADDGPGMAPDVRQRVFDPFFTTKGLASGTGLGLATAFATVRDHGGELSCESTLGAGARFVFRLPVAATPDQPSATDRPADVAGPANGAVALVVDDEAAVRRLATHILSAQGYRVLTAEDGDAALALTETVDVVLLDRSMPGPSCETVARRLRERHEAARILIFTGLDADFDVPEVVDGVLHKPLSAGALAAACRPPGRP